MTVSALVPKVIIPINGIRLASTSSGLYANSRSDLALLEISKGSVVDAVFTQNKFAAAPVHIAKKNISLTTPRYCLINAGNANAGNGPAGIKDATSICQALAALSHYSATEILPFSTGIIGEKLPVTKITDSLADLVQGLSAANWLNAATAIMTTDKFPKVASTQLCIDDQEISITGIAKGAGMIKPNMATMLSFIATDAPLSKDTLTTLLHQLVNNSFNRILVDGDTSTNDACVLIATGQSKYQQMITESAQCYTAFKEALGSVFCRLAQAIVKDGEGATKFINIEVIGGALQQDCLAVAYQIACSPLVKVAFTASDPNWGRILAAVGNAETKYLDITKVSIYLNELCIVENGQRSATYNEQSGKAVMSKKEITILVNLGVGSQRETVWTTDLSHEYIRINAEYPT